MDPTTAMRIVQEALLVSILISTPMLGLSMVVGLAISIFQTTTSIQEQTLTFVPKVLAILLAAAVFGNWMLAYTCDYTVQLWNMLPLCTP